MKVNIVTKVLLLTTFLCFSFLLPFRAMSAPTTQGNEELMDLDIESLMEIEVYSVSKKAQKLSDTTSAVFVINQEMIHKSGLTEIPEILRLAPGVQVSRITGNSWSVSIRGGSGRYGDMLLVMIDGRSIYTPLYAGVYWEDQDLPLQDIDRIEVIRGPGATIWGANAMNGVINIITKKAKQTQGSQINISTGSINTALATVRHGGTINDDTYYRMSLQYRNQSRLEEPNGTKNHDGIQMGHGDFRTDWTPNTQDSFSLQGSFFNGDRDENVLWAQPAPPYSTSIHNTSDSNGWDLVGSWNRQFSSDNQLGLTFYYDNTYKDTFYYSFDIDNWDIALQQQLTITDTQNLIYGLRCRYTNSDLSGKDNVHFNKAKRTDYLYSFFIQDEIELFSDELFLTLGSKFEYQNITNLEILPTARLLWKLTEESSVWAAVSRAVRSPSIADQDIVVEIGYAPINGDPSQLIGYWVNGNPDMESEENISYETGYRTNLTSTVSFDLTLFYSTYDNVRGFLPLQPVPTLTPVPHLRADIQFLNLISGYSYGFEVSATWNPLEQLRFTANYSNLQILVDDITGISDQQLGQFDDRTPTSLYNLTGNWAIQEDLDIGLYLYGSSKLSRQSNPVPSYLRCDLRLAWRPVPSVELSLVGQNLFDSEHTEYPSVDNLINSTIPMSIYTGLTLDF
jgi:iron complex outermembrane receptor protein